MNMLVKITCMVLFLYPFITINSQPIKKEFALQTADGIQLSGQVEYPSSKGSFDAAILIWGNGPHTRDQVISGTPTFKQLSLALLDRNIAVLRMDKRGFGKSSGNFESEGNYTTKDLADDVSLAYAYLKKQPMIDSTRIGLIGHSEGAIIASMIAAEDTTVGWIIVFGAPAVTGDSIIAEQTRHNRKQLGFSTGRSDSIGKVWEKYFQYIHSGSDDDSLYYSIGREFLVAHGLAEDDKRITNQFIDQFLSAYRMQWNRHFINTDHSQFYKQLKCPLLAIFGGEDKQVSVSQNFLPLYNALSSSAHPDYRLVVLSDEDHFFLRHNNKRVNKHIRGEMKVSPALINSVIEWLGTMGNRQ